ncbi:MAG: winged helix-turn-helix transcriptional regulator [Candidatus Aenigmarchaeota archaeon]|nr:winged helix-turn-helix transcriptional regulator [Candidatus Aenigmarchaeota archaeon]
MRPDLVHKALGNEIRQQLLLNLEKKEKYLSELAEELKLAPQTIDFHLNLLAELGLVTFEWKEGKKYYFLKDKKILEFLKGNKPIPVGLHPKPPHEIVMDAWEDLSKRLDRIEKKLDKLTRKK